MVKSNSLRATKSIAGPSFSEPSALTATLAPMRPALRFGFASFSAWITFTSDLNEGTEVWATTRSKSFAWATTSARPVLCGGASISLEFSTNAAGWASQVGYQKLLISRLAW